MIAELIRGGSSEGGGKRYKITTSYTIKIRDGNKRVDLPLHEEPSGTQQMFFFVVLIKRAMESEKTIVIDELSSGLHPLLLQAIIKMFYDKKLNTTNAQLIFSTQDISLLT